MINTSLTAVTGMLSGSRGLAGKGIAVLGAFFDDSGTHADAPLVVIGGVLGDADQWDRFAPLWNKLLTEPLPGKPKLSKFHLAPCRARDGEFSSYNRAECDRITYLFRRVIVDNGLVTFASALDLSAWRELVVGDLIEALPSPLEICFSRSVDLVISYIRATKPWELVYFFFDQGTEIKLEKWASFYRTQSAKYPEMGGIAFAPVGKLEALQAADMIATESYYYGLQWLKHGVEAKANPHFREYLTRELSLGNIFGREQIQEAIGLLKKKLRRPM